MAAGHIAFLSILSASRLGLRFCQARVWQNRAELSGVKEMATSGGVPPLMARTIASSSLPWTCLTVIHGYFCLTLSRTLVVTLALAAGEVAPDGERERVVLGVGVDGGRRLGVA